jgi:hypothetical protein
MEVLWVVKGKFDLPEGDLAASGDCEGVYHLQTLLDLSQGFFYYSMGWTFEGPENVNTGNRTQ